jgi:homocysteine S-methyltransferase
MASVTILDGGMGKELHRIGAPFRQPEWSALALLEEPTWVLAAHNNFIDAGAEIIITNTYAVVPPHIGDDRFAERGAELAELAASIARQAADEADRPILVAGSLPPLFNSYEPESFRADEAPALYDVLVQAQLPHVDVWLGETISSVAEYEAVRDAVAGTEMDLWASFTIDDEAAPGEARLRSGESMADLVAAVDGDVTAIMINCSQPERFSDALRELFEALGNNPHGIVVGAYANAFVEKEGEYASNEVVLGHREDLTPERYLDFAKEWADLGVTIIGGCCGITPDHIEALDDEFG